uniref:Uncharacterized protein n=1 Tax=Tanacetum cinerariifolium TaxID=118510 RepID=A0A6L2NWL8_TANCI|nr:hypothetical protein [Tanacetum cinerariifolium]
MLYANAFNCDTILRVYVLGKAWPTPLPDSTPPTRHATDSVDSDTFDARSTTSDSITPLSPDHPLTHASSTLVPILRRTACMVVRVLLAMSPGLPASIVEVVAMSDSTYRKRFRSSYESSPSPSPPDLPLRNHYRVTYELVENDDEEDGDEEDGDEEEDEEIEESLDSDSEREDTEDEGPTTKDEDPAAGDKGLAAGDEGPDMRVESLVLGEDADVHEGQQRVASVMKTTMGKPLGLGYEALRRREIALGRAGCLTPPSPEWSSDSLFVSPTPSIVPSPISSPMIPLTVPSPVASPATTETGEFLTKLGARVEMQGELIHDHMVRLVELSPLLFERILEHKHARVAVTFRAIWRLVLALESWAGQTDAQRAALWHAISDTQMEN